jgi:hypothetical protein
MNMLKMKNILIIVFIFFSFLAQSQTKKVLFIGNSYTYFNDMPEMVSEMAESTVDELEIVSGAIGGYSFKDHSTDSATLSLIKMGGWDYVVLQEFSTNPSESLSFVEK